MTEKIKEALKLRHSNERARWIYFDECPVGTGFKGSNYLDGFAFAAWPSEQNKRIAYEIKVSRNDFLNEIKKPWKRRPGMFFSNKFYFVTPKGLLKKEEIPLDCGLIEYEEKEGSERDRLVTVLQAPHRESIRPTWNFMAALLRRAVEPRTDRVFVGVDSSKSDEDEIKQLRKKVEIAIGALEKAIVWFSNYGEAATLEEALEKIKGDKV